MNAFRGRVWDITGRQRGAIARWQLRRLGASEDEAKAALKGLPRVFRGVCAVEDLDERGWLIAATLAGGPGAAVSHESAVQLLGLRPYRPGPIHVSVPTRGGRCMRDGLVFHRRQQFESGTYDGVAVTSPSQTLRDADLLPHELYRAIEQAEIRGYPLTLPLNGIFDLRQAIQGRTRSDAEAAFILLCHDHGLKLPRVNHRLNGFETDFHWHAARLVVEVDGFEFHSDRRAFERDRHRGAVHRIRGYEVVRLSALQVFNHPDTVIAAVLAAAPALSQNRPRAA